MNWSRKRATGKKPKTVLQEHSASPIAAVAEFAKYFWPTFVECGGCIFVALDGRRPHMTLGGRGRLATAVKARLRERGTDRTGLESSDHHHILDFFGQFGSVFDARRTRVRMRHPHFRAAETIGRIMAQCWAAKLHQDFPRSRFRVYFTLRDNPIVRFHRVYAGEHFYLDEKTWSQEIARGDVVIIDVAPTRSRRRRKK